MECGVLAARFYGLTQDTQMIPTRLSTMAQTSAESSDCASAYWDGAQPGVAVLFTAVEVDELD